MAISDPALAPLPTMIAIRNAGIFARPPTAIAIGAINAAEAMLPGPIEASAAATKKNITGMTPALPLQTRTALCASLSSVPFSCACENSSVMPTSVRNNWTGNPAAICSTVIAAEVNTDDPCHGDGKHTNVQFGNATQK